MRAIWSRLVESWKTFWWGQPCLKHPGHRVREMDMDELMPMCGNMCSECYEEFRTRYGL